MDDEREIEDLRPEFASRLVRRRGATLVLVRDVLGYTNTKMTSNYLRSSNIGLHDVFEGWEKEAEKTAAPAASRTNCAHGPG